MGVKIIPNSEIDNDTNINKEPVENSEPQQDGKRIEEDENMDGFRMIKPLLMNLKDVAILEP